MIKKLSLLIGFTETEIKVILFLIITLIVGFSYKTLTGFFSSSEYKNFDYTKEDSLFAAHNLAGIYNKTNDKPIDDNIDYKQEVLDFNESVFQESEFNSPLLEKSININEADVDELARLPGIGTKIAERIIQFRTEKGTFTKLEDLLLVNGIGESKFDKFKQYIFIEKSDSLKTPEEK
jgi:competence ComEA-like helix-hairpin-helix protein